MLDKKTIAERLAKMVDPPNPTARKQININCSVRDDARLAAIFPDIGTSAERLTALIRLVIAEWDGNFSPPYDVIGPEYAIAQFEQAGSGGAVLERWRQYMKDVYGHEVKRKSLQQGVYRWKQDNYPGIKMPDVGKLLKEALA